MSRKQPYNRGKRVSVQRASNGKKARLASADGDMPRWRMPALAILLAIITAAVYSPAAKYPFVNYDDPIYVTENQHVQAGISLQTLSWAATAGVASLWHPLTMLSHALDCQLYVLNAGGHHLTNLLLHIANVVLLFLLLTRVTGATGRSAMVAALFALHPFNVESVVWIAERKNVLSTFFFLLALGAYGWYTLRLSSKHYALLALLFVLGLSSKPMVITLPCVLLLLDYWPLGRIEGWTDPSPSFLLKQRPWRSLVIEKLPLFLLSAASAVVTIAFQQAGRSVEPLGQLPISWRVENAVYSYAMYVAKIFWPESFSVAYPHPLNSLTFLQLAFSLTLLLTVSAIVWRVRKRGYPITGWLWFLGTLVPVIGMVQVGGQGMADRYAYLPAIGIFVIISWGSADLLQACAVPQSIGAPLAIAALAALTLFTVHQIGYWRSSADLWAHALESTRNNFIADDGMADVLLHQGRIEALAYYEAAAKIAPWDPLSHAAVAANLADHGEFQQAISEYNIALQAQPQAKVRAHIYSELGVLYRELDNYPEARENSRRALGEDPTEVQVMIQQLSQLVDARPAAEGYWRLGLLLEGANQLSEARAAYIQALNLSPGFLPARKALDALGAGQ